jgi:hypothetical protein
MIEYLNACPTGPGGPARRNGVQAELNEGKEQRAGSSEQKAGDFIEF